MRLLSNVTPQPPPYNLARFLAVLLQILVANTVVRCRGVTGSFLEHSGTEVVRQSFTSCSSASDMWCGLREQKKLQRDSREKKNLLTAHPSSQLVVAPLLGRHVQHRRRYVHSHQLPRVVLEPAADQTRPAAEVEDVERPVEVGQHVAVVCGSDFFGQRLEGGVVDLLKVLKRENKNEGKVG